MQRAAWVIVKFWGARHEPQPHASHLNVHALTSPQHARWRWADLQIVTLARTPLAPTPQKHHCTTNHEPQNGAADSASGPLGTTPPRDTPEHVQYARCGTPTMAFASLFVTYAPLGNGTREPNMTARVHSGRCDGRYCVEIHMSDHDSRPHQPKLPHAHLSFSDCRLGKPTSYDSTRQPNRAGLN